MLISHKPALLLDLAFKFCQHAVHVCNLFYGGDPLPFLFKVTIRPLNGMARLNV